MKGTRVLRLVSVVVSVLAVLGAVQLAATQPSSAAAAKYVPIIGTGSTWIYPAMKTWMRDVQASITVSYGPSGSTAGRAAFAAANGLTDFEDPACCAQVQKFEMVVSKGKIKVVGATSRLRLKSLLARTGLSNVNPLQEDVFVQLRAEGATSDLLCAQVPASHFMKRRHRFRFWDRKQTVASAKGLQDVTIKVAPDGSVKFRTHGKHVQLTNVKQGNLELTVGFHSATAGDSQNRCSQTVQPFRTGSTGALLAP